MNDEFCGLEKLSIVDYDEKVAATLFTSGCNYRCPFCHNGPLVNEKEVKEIPFIDILNYLKKRVGIIDAVVITGGEPTLMPSLKEKISQIKKIGFLIKLDTNGTNPAILKQLIDESLIDYVAMDIKNSIDLYPTTTGVIDPKLDRVKESIDILKQAKSKTFNFEFRTTLVKEFHTTKSMIKLKELIMPTDKLVLQHFVSREGCINQGLHEIKKDEALEIKKALEEENLFVELRGY